MSTTSLGCKIAVFTQLKHILNYKTILIWRVLLLALLLTLVGQYHQLALMTIRFMGRLMATVKQLRIFWVSSDP